jgi:hypothetical protein
VRRLLPQARAAVHHQFPYLRSGLRFGAGTDSGSMGMERVDEDLGSACLAPLKIAPAACLDFAASLTWEKSARTFVSNIAEACAAEVGWHVSSRRSLLPDPRRFAMETRSQEKNAIFSA